jgi:hypothetical protein
VAYHRHQVLIAFGPALDDRVAVFGVLICNSFHHAAQMFQLCHLLYSKDTVLKSIIQPAFSQLSPQTV